MIGKLVHTDRNFATEVMRLSRAHAGALRPGMRAFWLMVAAIESLNAEEGRGLGIFREGVQRAAGIAYDKVSVYL